MRTACGSRCGLGSLKHPGIYESGDGRERRDEANEVPAPDVRPAIAKLGGEPTDEELRRRDHDAIRRWQRPEGVDPES
jgi:hypothetical protein